MESFLEYVEEKKGMPFEIQVFTKRELLLQYLENKKPELFQMKKSVDHSPWTTTAAATATKKTKSEGFGVSYKQGSDDSDEDEFCHFCKENLEFILCAKVLMTDERVRINEMSRSTKFLCAAGTMVVEAKRLM